MNIELHIERMVLDGLHVEPRDHALLKASVEAELTRLLSVNGLRPEFVSGGAVRSLAGGEIHLTKQISPKNLGNHIAQAVHNGIGIEARPGLTSKPQGVFRTGG